MKKENELRRELLEEAKNIKADVDVIKAMLSHSDAAKIHSSIQHIISSAIKQGEILEKLRRMT